MADKDKDKGKDDNVVDINKARGPVYASDAAKKAAADKAERDKKNRDEVIALQNRQHAEALTQVIDAEYECHGLRLSDPKSDHEIGVAVTFSKDEQAKLMRTVREILQARLSPAKKTG